MMIVEPLRETKLLDEREFFKQVLFSDDELPRLQDDGIVLEFVAEAWHDFEAHHLKTYGVTREEDALSTTHLLGSFRK